MASLKSWLEADSMANESHAQGIARRNSERLKPGSTYLVSIGDVDCLMVYEGITEEQEEDVLKEHSFIHELDGSNSIRSGRTSGYNIEFSDDNVSLRIDVDGYKSKTYPPGSGDDKEARDLINWAKG